MEDMKKLLREVQNSLEHLNKDYPELMRAFGIFLKEVGEKGALDTKTKELIAIALSVVSQCKWCIAFHTKEALKEGATKDEILEACFVAALMGGGPAMMFVQLVVKAIEDYQKG